MEQRDLLGKEFRKQDGSWVSVSSSGRVYDSSGNLGQINQYGDFISSDGKTGYRSNNFGEFISADGKMAGKIVSGNRVIVNNQDDTNSSAPAATVSFGGGYYKKQTRFRRFIDTTKAILFTMFLIEIALSVLSFIIPALIHFIPEFLKTMFEIIKATLFY